jgi:hypothetical protein
MDTDEISHQIPLMPDIYTLADEVVVWLGSDKAAQDGCGKEERLAFGLMAQISSEVSFTGENLRSLVTFTIPGEGPTLCWQSMVAIYENPWFDRIWVYQEIILASRATVLGQYYSIPWEELAWPVVLICKIINASLSLLGNSNSCQIINSINRIRESNAVTACLHRFARVCYNEGT